MRRLPYPLDRASNLEVVVPEDTEVCGLPEFPEDSDEQITILFRLSLNEFVALATAIDVGSDIAYGDDGLKVWYLWVASVMCSQFCEEMAECLNSENPAVVAALASLITNNQTIITAISNSITNAGSAIPGQPLSPTQSASDILPDNVKDGEDDCVLDALWGACLFLVQSGNRAITDFFEEIEAASNALETSAIAAQLIPAAGPYANAAVAFADQLQETLAEGYAGAYTETYENDLACALFCLARESCQLTPDMLMQVMAERVGYIEGTENFGVIMEVIGVGTWAGPAIADTAFWMYFGAISFGQQFGDILGIRPLTDLMSLGADQLASDNWEVLCDCPSTWSHTFDLTVTSSPFSLVGDWVEGVGIVSTGSGGTPYASQVYLGSIDWGDSTLETWLIGASSTTADGGAFRGFYYPTDGGATNYGGGATGDYELGGSSLHPQPVDFAAQISNATVPGTNVIRYLTLTGSGDVDPFE